MYREKDLELITQNIPTIESKANEIYINNYEPTIHENRKVYKVIKEYIKNNNLLVYGGYAQNSLIEKKDRKDAFYKESDLPDIEFYSYEPLKDLINICDILHKEGFKHVEGKEGVHPGTYKIFVNFVDYLDMSFMPKNVFKNTPYIVSEGLRMTHPHFMLIDAYRVYSDPMTSYFRLHKTFPRFTTLLNHYPFNMNSIYNSIDYEIKLTEKEYDKVYGYIKNKIIYDSKLIVIGFHAFNRLMKKAKMSENYFIQEPYYQLISSNYNEDKNKIFDLLSKNFKEITKKSYYPFFQFFDATTEYYYKDQLIMRLYGNNERCIVYNYSSKKKTHFGTPQLLILYLLAHYNLAIIRQNRFNQTVNMTMITRLFKARDKFLEKRNLTILDKSPFQEFTMKCIGDTVNPLRQALLTGLQRRKAGKKMKFSYRPSGNPGKVPDYRFDDISGNLIKK